MSPVNARPLTLLRTAAGSPPAVTQYRAFHALGCRIVAADCDGRSVGFPFADAAYVVPRVGAEGYLERMLEICRGERVDLFLPALDEELVLCSRNRARFEAVGTRVLVSGPEALAICTDKLLTFTLFRSLGIATPDTLPAERYQEGAFPCFPVVVKPRAGRGGAGVHVARTHGEAVFYAALAGAAVVQAFCPGEELTVDVLADWDSEVRILSPRRRLAVESGISSKGATCWYEGLLAPVRRMVKALRLVGPLNVQCFVAEDVRFTEINARIAGTAVLSQAAGVPYFEGILDLAAGRTPRPWLTAAEPLVMYRYWEEFYQKPGGA
jgi:carbamoyl-phosphate synthase large subunit